MYSSYSKNTLIGKGLFFFFQTKGHTENTVKLKKEKERTELITKMDRTFTSSGKLWKAYAIWMQKVLWSLCWASHR